jgi:osmotically-inducible protein OsmY
MPPQSYPDRKAPFQSQHTASQARERLQNNPYTARQGVSCDCDRGVLRLRGRLSTFYQKQVAQEAIKGLEGVVEVVNEIEVIG